MPETSYGPWLLSKLPGGAGVNAEKLLQEIAKLAIGPGVIDVEQAEDQLHLVFGDALSGAEKLLVDGGGTQDPQDPPLAGSLLGDHVGSNGAVLRLTDDNVLLTQPLVQTLDWQLCDRDIKIKTCEVDPAAAVEDLKVNLVTMLEEPWDECTLQGVYKLNGTQDAMELCADQADADASGTLSVFNYVALDQQAVPKVPCDYDLRDGGLVVDPAIPDAERHQHRIYAVAAPDLGALGHPFVRFFDGYMKAQPDGRIESKSPQAKRMSVAVTPAAATIRFYVFHPAGAKREHLIRLVTYRELGSV